MTLASEGQRPSPHLQARNNEQAALAGPSGRRPRQPDLSRHIDATAAQRRHAALGRHSGRPRTACKAPQTRGRIGQERTRTATVTARLDAGHALRPHIGAGSKGGNMSSIVFASPRTGQRSTADFAELVELLNGATITSLLDADRYVEFGLSEDLNLRIEAGDNGTVQVTVFSTLNPDDVPPTRLRIVEESAEPSAALVEERLRNLRQAYAIIFALYADREEALAAVLLDNPAADLEMKLLTDEERLILRAAGPGSWWVTVLSKVRGTGTATLNLLSLFYGEGRTMLLERVRAGTALKQEDVEAKRIANNNARVQGAIDLAVKLEKIKDPANREIVKRLLIANTSPINPTTAGLLSGPDTTA